MLDDEGPAVAEAEAALDLAAVREALTQLPGSLTAACVAERDER